MKYYYICLLGLISLQHFAQGEANNWYFGNNAGISFNTNPPTALTNGQLSTLEGCSSISDTGGNLLFYTDGRTVWDSNHTIMPNANYFGGSGLHGDPSSTQSGLIVPHPTVPDIYYIFTVDEPHQQNANAFPNQGPANANGVPLPNYDEGGQFTVPQEDDGFNNGFNYSVVDMSLRNGLGDVIPAERNIPLITYNENSAEEIKYKSSEKITAVAGADCNSIWVITHFLNRFYAFLIDDNGVTETPVISTVDPFINLNGYRRNAIGYIKASPDGEKLLTAHTQTSNAGNSNGNVYLYDFDDATGQISNPLRLINNVRPYGVEFSPASNIAYASSSEGNSTVIYQWDLEATDIPNSLFIQNTTLPQATALQLGPNGKIYTPVIGQSILAVINTPDELGAAMNFSSSVGLGAINLLGRNSNFGLPPFIQSIFTSRVDIVTSSDDSSDTTAIETELSVCDGDIISIGFEYDQNAVYQWYENGNIIEGENTPFLEISLPSNQETPFETAYTLDIFPETGECKLSGIANVIFAENPSLESTNLVQCVTDFENDSATFNLENANEALIATTGLTVEDFEFFYFETLEDASNNSSITNSSNYQNTANPQVVYVEVTQNDTRCSSIAEVQLIVDSVSGTVEVDLFACDTNLDGFQNFDLTLAEGLSEFTPTSYYRTINDALQDENAIQNSTSFSNTEAYFQAIYFRTNVVDGCGILGIANLRVNDLPFLFEDQEVFYCQEDIPNTIPISPDVPTNQIDDYTYFWPQTQEETFEIQINEIGNYEVQVTEIETGCQSTQNIVVRPSSQAVFQIFIQDGNETANEIEVVINEEESQGVYQYALENRLNAYQDSPIFTDLPPGFYTVYVRDLNGCGVVSREIGVIGARQFFTPNGDGINDTWNILGLQRAKNAQVHIFDRYGKLLVAFSANNYRGWDGTYQGKLMPNNDYWYQVKLDDGRILKGNFTLKR